MRKVVDYEFRAWDEITRQMAYFTLGDIRREYRNGFYYGNYVEREGRKIYLTAEGGRKNPELEVMQYTGLRDRYDVRIFEGDIMVSRTGTKGVVIYSKQGFVWQGCPQDQNNPMGYFSGKWQDDFEVIGNIHDNLEFLEV